MVPIQVKLIEYVKMHQLIEQHILAIVYKSMNICKIKNKQIPCYNITIKMLVSFVEQFMK
jgi:hypothetical protein